MLRHPRHECWILIRNGREVIVEPCGCKHVDGKLTPCTEHTENQS